MENSEKNELMDVTTAALLIGSVLERFTSQQQLTSPEQSALEYSRQVHLDRREELMARFNIDEEDPRPAGDDDGGVPVVDQKEKPAKGWA